MLYNDGHRGTGCKGRQRQTSWAGVMDDISLNFLETVQRFGTNDKAKFMGESRCAWEMALKLLV